MKKAPASESQAAKSCRELAVEILLKVDERKAYADILLDHALKTARLSPQDRALLTQLIYGTLRWRGKLDWRLSRVLQRPLAGMNGYLRNLLRLTLYQLFFLDRIPDYAAVNEGVELAKRRSGGKAAGLVNAVARRLLREKDRPEDLPEGAAAQRLSVQWSHPEWLVKRWLDYFGTEETEALLRADNEEPPLVLRANRLKGDREALLRKLGKAGVEAVPSPWSPQGIILKTGSPVAKLPGFAEGLFQVQGEASQLVAFLLDPKPGERILDACAAPGGKTTHLAELMEDRGEIVATDTSARGLEKVKENVRRLGLTCVNAAHADLTQGLKGKLAGPYDRMLADVPCSGLGTLRSHPEAKWHREEKDVERLSRLQRNLLEQLHPHLKPGGVLVYSTCTLAREENEEVVEDFLRQRDNFALEKAADYLPDAAQQMVRGNYFLALPHRHGTDGFFAARMRKKR